MGFAVDAFFSSTAPQKGQKRAFIEKIINLIEQIE